MHPFAQPDGLQHFRGFLFRDGGLRPWMRSGTLTFSMQFSVGMRLYCWKMNPMFAARNA